MDSMESFRRRLKSSSILPVPSTTQDSGSSAIGTGSPVSSRMRLCRSFSSAPPPVSTMPRSLMSVAKPLKEMVGTRRFELLTSTVSILRSQP
jgi:hypothetical protein